MSRTTCLMIVISLFVLDMVLLLWLRRKFLKEIDRLAVKWKHVVDEQRNNYSKEFSRWKHDNEKLKANIEGHENELMHAKHKTKEIQERYSDYYGKTEQLTLKHLSTISELQGKLAGATQEIEQLKAQLAVNVQALKGLSFGGIATGVISKSDYDQLKQEYDLTTKNMVQWMTKCSTLEAERQVYESATSQLEQWTSRCAQLQLHVNNLLAENESLKLQLTGEAGIRSQTMFDELKKKHAEGIDNQRMNWDEHVKQKDAEITHLKQVLSDTVTTLNERYSSIVQENEKLKTDNDWLQKECKKLQDEVDKPIKVIRVDENNNPLE